MSDLLKKPFGTHGKVHEITPQSAGWRYVGFSLYHLRAGERAAELTGDREVILVMVEGKAQISGGGQNWGVLGARMSVFEKTPHIVFICPMTPIGRLWLRPIVSLRCAQRRAKVVMRHGGLAQRASR